MKNSEITYQNLSTDYKKLYKLLEKDTLVVGFVGLEPDIQKHSQVAVINSWVHNMNHGFENGNRPDKNEFEKACKETNVRFFDILTEIGYIIDGVIYSPILARNAKETSAWKPVKENGEPVIDPKKSNTKKSNSGVPLMDDPPKPPNNTIDKNGYTPTVDNTIYPPPEARTITEIEQVIIDVIREKGIPDFTNIFKINSNKSMTLDLPFDEIDQNVDFNLMDETSKKIERFIKENTFSDDRPKFEPIMVKEGEKPKPNTISNKDFYDGFIKGPND